MEPGIFESFCKIVKDTHGKDNIFYASNYEKNPKWLLWKWRPVLPSLYKINLNPCFQCQFTSFQPYVLKQHILKKHTKTVKYECDECSFSTYSGHKAVRMHKKKMHNVGKDLRPFQCSECEKNYKSKGNLADHLFEVHNIVYQYETNQGIKSSHL